MASQPANLTCPRCHKSYSTSLRTPRKLACEHTICQQCAGALLMGKTRIVCPFDGAITHGVTSVTQLPRDLQLMGLVDVEYCQRLWGEERKVDVKRVVEVVKKVVEVKKPSNACVENEWHEAQWYCHSCSAIFCESCFATVHSSRVNSSHKKLPISERPYQLPKCATHPNNTAEFTCTCSSTPFCQTCLLLSHKDHTFQELSVCMENKKNELTSTAKKLTALMEQLQKEVQQFKNVHASNSAERKKIEKKIVEHYEEKKKKSMEKLASLSEKRMKEAVEHLSKVDGQREKIMEYEKQTKEIVLADSLDVKKVDEVISNVNKLEVVSKLPGALKPYPDFEQFL